MADDDDDYMGDLSRFLQPHDLPPTSTISEASPAFAGLNREQRRKLRRAHEQKTEDEKRSEGLRAAISSSNIGFKMLQQMGYKPGAALGKHGQGNLEPLGLDVKRSRTGLGRDQIEKTQELTKAKIAEFKQDINKRKQKELEIDFQERRKSNWQSWKLIRDYRKARTALQHLEGPAQQQNTESLEAKDSQDGVKEDGSSESDEEIELQDLQELLLRLRSEYFYCLYCGCQYEDADTLQTNCPGMDEEDH